MQKQIYFILRNVYPLPNLINVLTLNMQGPKINIINITVADALAPCIYLTNRPMSTRPRLVKSQFPPVKNLVII